MEYKHDEPDREYRGHTIQKVFHAGRLDDAKQWYYTAIATGVSYQVRDNILMHQTLAGIRRLIDANFRKKYKDYGREE
jgi:hypothetical protein